MTLPWVREAVSFLYSNPVVVSHKSICLVLRGCGSISLCTLSFVWQTYRTTIFDITCSIPSLQVSALLFYLSDSIYLVIQPIRFVMLATTCAYSTFYLLVETLGKTSMPSWKQTSYYMSLRMLDPWQN